MKNIDLKALERKAWTSTFEDGIVDIGIGLVLVVSAVCQMFSDIRYYLYLLYLLPPVFILLAKRYITVPRAGIVKFSRERNRKRYLLAAVMTASILILLTLTVTAKKSIIPAPEMGAIIVGAIIFIIGICIAFFLNYNRMYIYAVLLTLSFYISEISIARTGVISGGAYAWLVSALILIITGAVYLNRFLKKYPKLP